MENSSRREANSAIDLIDVWIIIRRHAWLFWIVFAVIAALGTVYAVIHTPKYEYTATVQIGALRNDKTGSLDQIISPEYVVETLNNIIVPAVAREYAGAHPGFNPHSVDVEVSAPQASSLVVIGMRRPLAQAQLTMGLLAAIENKLVKDEGAVIQTRLDATREFLTSQITKLQSDIAALNTTREKLLAHGNQTDKLFTSLLIDNQISNLQKRLLDLESQLDVDLITNIRPMRALGEPQQSLQPTGISISVKVLLSLILGVFAGLMAVFLRHFYRMARERSTQ